MSSMKIDVGMTAEQLKAKWKATFDFVAGRVFTWTEDHAMAYLAEQAQHCMNIVESGTYMGASALMMLESTGLSRVFCVDPFEVAGTEKVTRYFLEEYIQEGRAHVMPMKSEPAAAKLKEMGLEGKIDMVWVDDGHAYEDVCYDIDCWLPMLKKNGLLCGHDFDPGSEVARAVKDKLPTFSEPVGRLWAHIKP